MALKRGKVARRPAVLETRPLTREDLACLTETRAPQGRVKAFRDSHHRVARLIAAGLRPEEVHQRSGYSIQRILLLKQDPAFQELIAQYRKRVDASYEQALDNFYEVATANMLKSEQMLSDKLDDAIESGEVLPTRDLIAISRDAADRFGYGKKSLNVNLNADMGSALERAIARSGKGPTLDAKVISAAQSPTLAPSPARATALLTPPVTHPSQGPTTPTRATLGASLRSRAVAMRRSA